MPNIRELKKEKKIKLIEEFYKENGRLPKKNETAPDGTKIGLFLVDVKMGGTKITEEQLERLEQIGFRMENVWSVNPDVEHRIELVEAFYKENNKLPGYNEVGSDGSKIGVFVMNVKRKRIRIAENQRIRLEKLGLQIGSTVEDKKEKKIQLVEEFYKENGRLPKQNEKAPDGTAIGSFLKSIKQKNVTITETQLERLERLGFSMEVMDIKQKIENKIRLIEDFYCENGRLPNSNETKNGISIGSFLYSIKLRRKTITDEQYERLKKFGFRINDLENSITREKMIELIEEFYNEHHRFPNPIEKSKDGISIGKFLSSVKLGKIKLSNQLLQRLENLGFSINSYFERKKIIENLKKERDLLLNQTEIENVKVLVK